MWDVRLHREVEAWFLELCASDPVSAGLIAEAIDLLAQQGPALGRPMVDRLKGSIYHTKASEVRLIFAFDPAREAIFLVAGDKAGRWQAWYRDAVALADDRFTAHLAELEKER